MSAVTGASLGSSGLRGVITDNGHPGVVLEVHEPIVSEPAPNGLAPDPWDTVITSVHDLATEYASGRYFPVLALRESDPRTAYDQDLSDGVMLVSELGAQLGALRETGVLAGERCVALFDVGASGTSVSVVDIDSGRVLAARRTDELSGDDCDRVLCEHLISTFGAAEALTVEARRQLVHDVRNGKHELSLLRSVSILGPFVGERVSLWRGDLDELVRDSVHRAVSMAVDVLDAVGAQGIHIDAVVAVGGGANMQIVQQVLFDAVSMPVYVPEQPELLAARGAAGIARTAGLRPAPTPRDALTDRFPAVERGSDEFEVAAVAPVAVVSKRPRHSDTSSRRTTRANKSRHLGGALAALVAVCVAGTMVAAAARSSGDDPVPSVDSSRDSSQIARSQSVVPAADGSPAASSLPLASTTATPSAPVGASATSSSSETPTTTDPASSTTARRAVATTGAPSAPQESTASERPTRDQATVAPTTAVPPATTTRPTTAQPTTTRATTTTRTTTTRATTTTRSTRPFDLPFPDLGLPRR